jgi:hypothetical protein
LSTSRARLAGSFSAAGATKSEGCSAQYEEYSVRDTPERMKGGAVREEMSPLKEAIDYVGSNISYGEWRQESKGPYFKKGSP